MSPQRAKKEMEQSILEDNPAMSSFKKRMSYCPPKLRIRDRSNISESNVSESGLDKPKFSLKDENV